MSPDQEDLAPDDENQFDLETATLEQPLFGEIDWGGDGSDPHRPVRTHVLQALLPNNEAYPPPVAALLRLGDPRAADLTERRRAIDLTQEHAPHLLRMARDRALNTADSDTLEVWAPVHAVEALSELNTTTVVADLLPLLDVEGDWLDTLLSKAFARAGHAAVEPLRRYLLDTSRWTYGRSNAGSALVELARQHPELRNAVLDALRHAMADAKHNTEAGNGLLIACLLELDAQEALPEIRNAFASGKVDEMVAGDWATVQHTLGVEPDPGDTLVIESERRWKQRQEEVFPSELRERFLSVLGGASDDYEQLEQLPDAPTEMQQFPAPRISKAGQQAKKAKHKRKVAAASRKANKRKRK